MFGCNLQFQPIGGIPGLFFLQLCSWEAQGDLAAMPKVFFFFCQKSYLQTLSSVNTCGGLGILQSASTHMVLCRTATPRDKDKMGNYRE